MHLRWVNKGCLCDFGISGAHRMLGRVSNRFCFKTAIGGQSFTELRSGLQFTVKSRILRCSISLIDRYSVSETFC